MTIEEAIKHAEEVAESQEYEGKKLEESGEKYHDEYENYCASQCFECAEEHRQLAEWLKDYKRLLEQPIWIPVSERLPESDGYYLVTEKSGIVGTYVFHKEGNSEEYWKRCAVAWQPLPEPYKAESEVAE